MALYLSAHRHQRGLEDMNKGSVLDSLFSIKAVGDGPAHTKAL